MKGKAVKTLANPKATMLSLYYRTEEGTLTIGNPNLIYNADMKR